MIKMQCGIQNQAVQIILFFIGEMGTVYQMFISRKEILVIYKRI